MYKNMMRALCATIIASAYRRHREYNNYRGTRRKATTLQKIARGYIARRASSQIRDQLFQQRVLLWSSAATLIASWYRGKRQQRSYEKQRRRNFLLNLCASQIQAQFRRYSAQKYYRRRRSAIKIQTQFRRFCAELNYQQLWWAVAILQFQARYVVEVRADLTRWTTC